MKGLFLLLFLISISLFSVEVKLNIKENKNMFFIFSSVTNYEIKSNNQDCIVVDDKYSKSKEVFQKAIYIKSVDYEKCNTSTGSATSKNNSITIKYGNQGEYIIPISFTKNESNNTVNNTKTSDKFKIHAMFTPSGILMMEILRLREPQASKTEKKIPSPINSDSSKYKITFPWLCLEYCGGDSGAEIAEFARNKDVLSSVSYERYTMDNGTWTTLNLTNPTTTVKDNDLEAWPMIRSDSRTYNEDEMATNLESIWTNRETLATNMVNNAINNNYTGYCMDIEFQTSRSSTRDKYMEIVDFFADKLHESGKKLMVAHAHWATMAPMTYLKNTSVDYVATMDPYTASDLFFRKNGDETQGQAYEDYNQIQANRLIWGFAWEFHIKSTQEAQWEWLQSNGYNEGVVGAAVWRTPAENSCKSGCDTATEGINYYDAFEHYYPIDNTTSSVCDEVTCSNHGECQEINNQAVCDCNDGYHVQNLECIRDIEVCTNDITCSNHGTCDDSTGIVICNCDENYVSAGLECISNTTIKKKIIKTINSESFNLSGALPYFHNENIGLDNKSIFCYQSNQDSENKLSLTFYGLEPGSYRIFSYIPSSSKLSTDVDYTIKNGSDIKISNINQVNAKDDWAYLGEYEIQENLELSISCYKENSVLENFKKIYFSAIKLELLEQK